MGRAVENPDNTLYLHLLDWAVYENGPFSLQAGILWVRERKAPGSKFGCPVIKLSKGVAVAAVLPKDPRVPAVVSC